MRPNNRHIVLLLSAWIMTGFSVHGQQAEAISRLDSSSILIGQQTGFTLELSVPEHSRVNWPFFADSLSKHVEIIRKSSVDTVSRENGRMLIRQKLVVTSFDSGSFNIPSIPIGYRLQGDTTRHLAMTGPVSLEVGSVKVDQDKDIRPIKPPLKAPLSLSELMPWILAFLALALIATSTWYLLRKRGRQEPVFEFRPKPVQAPYDRAMNELEALRLKKLWQQGRVKEYHSELTGIVRNYIEDRFGVRALEMTTWEIMQGIRRREIPDETRAKLHEALSLADMVKFAKARPLPLENDQSWSHCHDFVEATRPAAQTIVAVNPQVEQEVEPKPEA